MIRSVLRFFYPRLGLPQIPTSWDWKAMPPVRWYSARTVIRSAIGLLRVKRKSLRPKAPVPTEPYRLTGTKTGDKVTVDYVADVGDGFHAAYSTLLKINESGPPDALVLGGDQAYPTPSQRYREYQNRLLGPLSTAFRGSGTDGKNVELFSVPGNHDYYDGLKQYSKLLLAGGGASDLLKDDFTVSQREPNWLLALPHGWAILGVDFGEPAKELENAILEHFRRELNKINDERGELARCVLVVPTPAWLYGAHHPAAKPLAAFEMALESYAQIELVIAGDRHCYMRHQLLEDRISPLQPMHRVTAGAGGSFLHMPKVEPQYPEFNNDRYAAVACYPSGGFIERMKMTNPVNFVLKNPGLLLGLMVVAFGLAVGVDKYGAGWAASGWYARLDDALRNWPGWLVLALLFVLGLGHKLPADITRVAGYFWRVFFAAAFAASIGAAGLTFVGIAEMIPGPWLLRHVAIAVIGGALLTTAEGLVLWAYAAIGVSATSVYGGAARHDRRSWLRLEFRRTGLTVTAFGVERTCCEWTAHEEAGASEIRPTSGRSHGLPSKPLAKDCFVISGSPVAS